MYHKGQGMRQDYAQAAKWFRRAAERGHAKAQYNLGVMYGTGRGVPQNNAEAVRWYRLAAEQGQAEAQLKLMAYYFSGTSVPKDYVLTHMWSNLAVARLPPGERHEYAVNIRDNIENLMTPAQLAEAQRLARDWKPKKKLGQQERRRRRLPQPFLQGGRAPCRK